MKEKEQVVCRLQAAAAQGRIPTLPILLLTISSKLLFAYKIAATRLS